MSGKEVLIKLRSTANLPVPAAGDPDGTVRVNVIAGGVGGGIMTVADGGDATQGLIADVGVVIDGPGTISAKLRGIVTLLAGRLPLSLGQKAGAGSLAVVLASEQMPTDSTAFTPTSDPYMPIGGEFDDAAPAGLAEGQGGALRLSSRREAYTTIRDAAGNERGLNIDANGDIGVTLPGVLEGPGSPSVDSYTSAAVDLAASGANQVLVAAPGASKQIWVYGLFMMADTAAGTVTLQDEDDTALSGTMAVSDEGGWVLPMSGNFAMPWVKVATNKALEADTGACTVDGILTYAVVSV